MIRVASGAEEPDVITEAIADVRGDLKQVRRVARRALERLAEIERAHDGGE